MMPSASRRRTRRRALAESEDRTSWVRNPIDKGVRGMLERGESKQDRAQVEPRRQRRPAMLKEEN